MDESETLTPALLYDSVETKRLNDMELVCRAARVACIGVGLLCIAFAILLPILRNPTRVLTWLSLALGAGAVFCFYSAAWIKREVIKQ